MEAVSLTVWSNVTTLQATAKDPSTMMGAMRRNSERLATTPVSLADRKMARS
jgi:hypothetical protein